MTPVERIEAPDKRDSCDDSPSREKDDAAVAGGNAHGDNAEESKEENGWTNFVHHGARVSLGSIAEHTNTPLVDLGVLGSGGGKPTRSRLLHK